MKWFALLWIVSALWAQSAQVQVMSGASGNLKTQVESNTAKLMNALEASGHQGQPLGNIEGMTEAGQKSLGELWTSEPFFPLDIEFYGNLVKCAEGFQLRGLQVQLSKSKANEELVLTFDASGKILDIRFAIAQHQVRAILGSGTDVKDFRHRQYVLDFVENFRTAYNRKDLDFIGKVFSDQALIVVGKVLKPRPNSEGMNFGLNEKTVQLVTYNKKQYLSQLESTFKANKKIAVTYDSISVFKHPDPRRVDWYAVELRQVWKSTGYSDVGYVFLLIDFTDENKPTIWVRSWQPQKETKPEEKLNIGDFDIVD